MHRVGGIEKEDGTGNISYDPENHDKMTRLRAAKIAGIANDIPPVDLDDPDGAELSCCRGAAPGARRPRRCAASARAASKIAHVHLRAPQPVPRATSATSLRRYRKVLVPEMNLGQLSKLVRAEYLVDAQSFTQMCRRAVPRRRARARRSWR